MAALWHSCASAAAGSDAPATGVSLVGGRDDKGVTPNERIKNLVELRTHGPGTGCSVSDVEVIPLNARGQKCACCRWVGGYRVGARALPFSWPCPLSGCLITNNEYPYSPAWFRDVAMRIAGVTAILEKTAETGRRHRARGEVQ